MGKSPAPRTYFFKVPKDIDAIKKHLKQIKKNYFQFFLHNIKVAK